MGKDSLVIHLTLVPYLTAAGELKTKPTQHSVQKLQESGLQPDILVCRSEYTLGEEIRKKLALFCNVEPDCVVESLDAETIYDVPLLMKEQNLAEVALRKLNLPISEPDLKDWEAFLKKLKNPKEKVEIGLVGKYVELKDSYKSIAESFVHAGAHNETEVELRWVHSEEITEENASKHLKGLHGILVAPGFGERGIDGKLNAVKYARENNIPFLGICLGMQCAVVEFARNVVGLKDA